MTSSKQYADKDDAVTLTCSFTDPASITATVTWYKDDSATTTGVSKPSAGKSIITIASAAYADTAEYKCKVDYSATYGSKTGTMLKQYIRGIETGITGPQNLLIGSPVTHTCTVHGDVLTGNVVWTNTKGALETGSRFTQATKSYVASSHLTTSTLAISAVTADDTTSFTCTVEYTQGPTAKEGFIVFEVLRKLH